MKKPILFLLFLLCLGAVSSHAQIRLDYFTNPYSEIYTAGHLQKDYVNNEPDDDKCYFVSKVEYVGTRRERKERDVAIMKINGKKVTLRSRLRPAVENDYIHGTTMLSSTNGIRVRFRESGKEDNWKITLTVYLKNQTKTIVLKAASMGD